MLWEDFLLSTVRPYPADWIVDGGWGCINYLIRLDEGCVPFCVLGQNGGLKVEGDDEADNEYDDGAGEGIPEDAQGQGLPDTEGSDWSDEDDPEEDATRHGRGCFGRLSQVNRRLTYRR